MFSNTGKSEHIPCDRCTVQYPFGTCFCICHMESVLPPKKGEPMRVSPHYWYVADVEWLEKNQKTVKIETKKINKDKYWVRISRGKK